MCLEWATQNLLLQKIEFTIFGFVEPQQIFTYKNIELLHKKKILNRYKKYSFPFHGQVKGNNSVCPW